MTPSHPALSHLSDRQLMECLHAVVGRDCKLTAELLEHLGEVDVRGLCAHEAEGSLYMYCVKVLRFSEGCAYKRIAAARVAREYPVVLDMVARGDLHVSAINMLIPHLTAENHRELLTAAARKTKRELAELIAERFPKPDAETTLRKLPEPRAERRSPQLASTAAPSVAPSVPSPLVPNTQGATASPTPTSASVSSGAAASQPESLSPATLVLSSPATVAAAPVSFASAPAPGYAPVRPQDRASVQPLSPGRYKLQVTLSRQGRDDLLHAQELMRHQLPDGDLAVVVERAVSLLVQELERRKFGRLNGRGKHGWPPATGPTDAEVAAAGVIAASDSSRAPEPRSAGTDPADRRQAQSPSGMDATARQGELRLAPGANTDGDQQHGQLDSRANAGGDLPHGQLDPGANADGRQPNAQLSPATDARVAPHPGRGSRHDAKRRERPKAEAPSRDVPRAVRRRVVQRDEMQCTYVGPDGRRCQAREFLEFHHIVPFARGGRATAANVCLRCRVHHGLATARDFGAKAVLRHKKRHPR